MDNFKVGYIKWLITVLIVLTNATVGPIAFLNGALVFLPSGLTATASLATIDVVAFRAYVLVYPWFLSRVNFTFIFAA